MFIRWPFGKLCVPGILTVGAYLTLVPNRSGPLNTGYPNVTTGQGNEQLMEPETSAVEVTVVIPDTEPQDVVVETSPTTTSSDAVNAVLIADAIESAEFEATILARIDSIEERLVELQAATVVTAVLASEAIEESEPEPEPEPDPEPEPEPEHEEDSAPNREHPFYRSLGGK